jgi:hypothetical protein
MQSAYHTARAFILLAFALCLSSCATYTTSQALADASAVVQVETQYKALRAKSPDHKVTTAQKAALAKQFADQMLANHPGATATQIQGWLDLAYNTFQALEPSGK